MQKKIGVIIFNVTLFVYKGQCNLGGIEVTIE